MLFDPSSNPNKYIVRDFSELITLFFELLQYSFPQSYLSAWSYPSLYFKISRAEIHLCNHKAQCLLYRKDSVELIMMIIFLKAKMFLVPIHQIRLHLLVCRPGFRTVIFLYPFYALLSYSWLDSISPWMDHWML